MQRSTSSSSAANKSARPRLWRILASVLGSAIGLAALAWFLIRVVPKPSRASYPCQRAAFPLASAFVLWIAGALGGWALAARFRLRIPRLRHATMVLGLITVAGLASWHASQADTTPNKPVGTARGIHPGQVVWSHDPAAALWSGNNSDGTHWWDPAQTDQTKVDALLSS